MVAQAPRRVALSVSFRRAFSPGPDPAPRIPFPGLRVVEKGGLDGQEAYVATHQFVWGLYLDELLVYDFDADTDGDFDAIDEEDGDTRSYTLQDFIYSTHAVIDSTGAVLERYDYEPYGAPSFWDGSYTIQYPLSTCHCPFLFTGQMYDRESGLYDYKARMYLPSVATLAQRDALGNMEGDNLYQYALSLPSAITDPFGLQATTTRPATSQPAKAGPVFDIDPSCANYQVLVTNVVNVVVSVLKRQIEQKDPCYTQDAGDNAQQHRRTLERWANWRTYTPGYPEGYPDRDGYYHDLAKCPERILSCLDQLLTEGGIRITCKATQRCRNDGIFAHVKGGSRNGISCGTPSRAQHREINLCPTGPAGGQVSFFMRSPFDRGTVLLHEMLHLCIGTRASDEQLVQILTTRGAACWAARLGREKMLYRGIDAQGNLRPGYPLDVFPPSE